MIASCKGPIVKIVYQKRCLHLPFDAPLTCFRICLLVILVALGVFFGLDTAKKPVRFISLAGLFANVLFCWIFSKHRRKVTKDVHSLTTARKV